VGTGIDWWGWGGDGDEFYYRVILYFLPRRQTKDCHAGKVRASFYRLGS